MSVEEPYGLHVPAWKPKASATICRVRIATLASLIRNDELCIHASKPFCSYPQGRLGCPEDCFFTQRSLPRESEKAFLAGFPHGNAAAFQEIPSLIVLCVYQTHRTIILIEMNPRFISINGFSPLLLLSLSR
jgi:hypothetical protein